MRTVDYYRQPGTDPEWPAAVTDADLDRALERNDVAYLYRVAGALLAEVERAADGAKAIETLAEIKSEIDYARGCDGDADKDCMAAIARLVAAP